MEFVIRVVVVVVRRGRIVWKLSIKVQCVGRSGRASEGLKSFPTLRGEYAWQVTRVLGSLR
jgi:hypothetical protein